MKGSDIYLVALVVVTIGVAALTGGETMWRWQDEHAVRSQGYAIDLVRGAARIDTLAMSAPHPVLANYDSLVDAVATCRRQLQALEAHHGASTVSPAERAALAEFSLLLKKRTTQVEQLKSQHAGQRNARRALVRWLADEQSDGDQQVDALRRALSVFLLAPRNVHEVELVRTSKAVETRDSYARISRQVRVLMSTERQLTTLIPDILREPLAAVATRVADSAIQGVEQAKQARVRIRQIGFALVAFAALGGLWWPTRRRKVR